MRWNHCQIRLLRHAGTKRALGVVVVDRACGLPDTDEIRRDGSLVEGIRSPAPDAWAASDHSDGEEAVVDDNEDHRNMVEGTVFHEEDTHPWDTGSLHRTEFVLVGEDCLVVCVVTALMVSISSEEDLVHRLILLLSNHPDPLLPFWLWQNLTMWMTSSCGALLQR